MPTAQTSLPPRADSDDTRNAIKAAAARLFAARDMDNVTIREIVTAAGQKNGASLHYYFGNKDELVRELVADGAKLMNQRRNRMLDEIEKAGGPTDLRQVVEVIVRPTLGLAPGGADDDTYASVISMLYMNHRELLTGAMKRAWETGFMRCVAHIRRLSPDTPEAVLGQRLIFMVRFLNAMNLAREQSQGGTAPDDAMWRTPQAVDVLIDAIEAILASRPSEPTLLATASARPSKPRRPASKA